MSSSCQSKLSFFWVFLNLLSSISSYEGTGRSLSLKLIQQLREKSANAISTKVTGSESKPDAATPGGRLLWELTLNESIRYANRDVIEKWLNELLCLDATVVPRISSGCPVPEDCDLYPS